MKELKAFIVVVIVTGIIYWGVEPYAHSVLNPHVEPANFDFAKEDVNLAKTNEQAANKALEVAKASGNEDIIKSATKTLNDTKANLDKYTAFWNDINSIDLAKGDAAKGAELVNAAGCTGCHGIKTANIPAPMDDRSASESFGVTPPDLSDIGYLYDPKFLAALIKDPAIALKVSHKFNDNNPFPMTAFMGAGGDLNAEVADLVAYFKSIAPKEMSDKEVFVNSCSRCHDMKYANVFTNGNKQSIAAYLGMTPPDLSMYIRSRSNDYLNNFINDTQKMLPGTAMPRVGLNEKAQSQVISYMEKVGDSKKAERETTSLYMMGYFLILGIFAWAWKRKIWSKLH
ncbi:ubiquinol cytochrome c oxidoreductase PetABC, membrane-bound cytochrome c subunit [Campylobacter iguaniorum]|uniref:c-type cytochrome n=1 Tax=Campylobacter iguaniorum TaxID=1244531 RepID=UPI00073A143E|nr:c-type cytochrome [Campylobacter iguaniorum]ALV25199.1 ubiquinol cytochrome c oxidoreductase PetABC, membrane-bound cytochrome c subunit [Campylobacter iguaniorum]